MAATMYRQAPEIDSRLRPFGVTRAELVDVVRGVVAARADAVENDPITAEGLFAYIYGTRCVRDLFTSKGWLHHRRDNIESVKHPSLEVKVIYQSVDLAADPLHRPQAISGKGSGADRIISSAQGSLFPPDQLAPVGRTSRAGMKTGVWFFCVSVAGDEIRAELSLPSAVSGGNFEDFLERIFIVQQGEWATFSVESLGGSSDAAEFEPRVMRKK